MDTEDTFTITGKPLRPHEYVIIRREMTAADYAYIQNHSMMGGGTQEKPELRLLAGDAHMATVKRMVVGWQLTRTVKRADGQEEEVPLPYSKEAIERLPLRIFKYIHKVISSLNPDDEESDQDFTPAANGHSEANLDQTSLFPLRD